MMGKGDFMKKATKIFYNGNVLTVDQANSVGSAVAINGDRILKVGSDREILAFADDKTEKIDLKQKTLIPGFYDAHGHFLADSELQASCVDLNSAPIGKCQTFADCIAVLKAKMKETPKGDWVQGYGFDDTMIAEKRFLTRHELDAVSKEHPVVARHISGHLWVANTMALEKFGYTKDTVDPAGGVIRREADGTPNGVLEEAAMFGIAAIIPSLEKTALKKALSKNALRYASKGITTAIEAGFMKPAFIDATHEVIVEKAFGIRLLCNCFHGHYDAFSKMKVNDHIQLGGVKFLQDGSIQGYTAYLSKPYHTPYNGDASWIGYPIMKKEDLFAMISKYHKQEIQIVIHTNGDQATEDVLDALEAAQKEFPRFDPRVLLVHAQTVREEQFDRFKKLGVTPTFFTAHTYYWGDRHKALFLGPERAERQNAMQSALKRGIVCTSHCDTPVTPIDQLLSMWVCVNRVSSTGQLIGADHRISAVEALRAHTINGAWQNFQEKDKGSLEPGKFADFAVLDTDPTTCDPMKIRDIKVLATYLGGNLVFENK